LEEQLLVGWQTRRVGQEHAEGDVAAAGIGLAAGVGHEFGDYSNYRSFEFELTAFVEEHRHCGGGDWFGQGREVEESRGRDVLFRTFKVNIPTLPQRTRQGWGTLRGVECEMAEGLESYDLIPVGDGDGGGGEGAG
jgi:hypothetical protein